MRTSVERDQRHPRAARALGLARRFSGRFPQILDDYVLREFITYVAMVLASFLVLTLIFTFFRSSNFKVSNFSVAAS